MNKRNFKGFILFVVASSFLLACSKSKKETPYTQPNPEGLLLILEDTPEKSISYAIERAGIENLIDNVKKVTVFLPTDEAFNELLAQLGPAYQSLDDFDTDIEKALLKELILYHISAPQKRYNEFNEGSLSTLLEENVITIIFENGNLLLSDYTANEAGFVEEDLIFGDIVIHKIDKVLIPKAFEEFIKAL